MSGGEDLSRGPTPRTRHPDGDADDVRDTTQGPTPQIRRAFRLEDADEAAGEPALDRPTREDRGGSQDRLDDADLDRHAGRSDPDAPRWRCARPRVRRPAPTTTGVSRDLTMDIGDSAQRFTDRCSSGCHA